MVMLKDPSGAGVGEFAQILSIPFESVVVIPAGNGVVTIYVVPQ
jgi:hypothetical protein